MKPQAKAAILKRAPQPLPKAHLGIDLDSTLANFPKAAIRLFQEQANLTVELEGWTTKRVDQCFGKTADLLLREAMSGVEFWENLEPIEGCIKELVKLMPSYQLHIITLRHERIEQLTHDWCCLNEIPFDTVDVVSSRDEKLPLAKSYGCIGFIDDDDDICEQMDQAGLVTGQLIWPWNHAQGSVIRRADWNSLAYAVDLKLQDTLRGQ